MVIPHKLRTKILIHSPIHNNYPEFWKALFNLDTEGLEVDYLFTYTDKVEPQKDKKGNYDVLDITINLTYKMEKARKTVLCNKYDYLFNIEDDNIVPQNALKELLKWKKDVISGVYRLRPSKRPDTPIAATSLKTGTWITEDDLKEPLLEVNLVPWGCLLLSRKVLEKVDFKDVLDGGFTKRLERNDFKRYLATNVRVGHIDKDKTIIEV